MLTEIGWDLALLVWDYALVWFLINDCVTHVGYRIFDHERTLMIAQRKMAAPA